MQVTAARPVDEAITGAKSRQGFYELAARVFVRELDLQFLKTLRDGNVFGALSRRLLDGFEGRKDNEIIEELAIEYSSCFLSSGAFLSPYESVQASTEGQLCGPAATHVFRFYEEAGFTVQEGSTLFADHFAVELEFMGHLCAMEASSLEKGDTEGAGHATRLQAEFMSRHLGKWYRPFLEKASEAMEHPFYREFASITAEFLDSEQEYMRHEH